MKLVINIPGLLNADLVVVDFVLGAWHILVQFVY